MDPATTAVVSEALKLGILGPILIAAAWFIRHLQMELKLANEARAAEAERARKDLMESEARRAADAQEMVTRLLSATERWQKLFAESGSYAEGLIASQEKVQGSVRDLEEVMQDVVRSTTESNTLLRSKERR